MAPTFDFFTTKFVITDWVTLLYATHYRSGNQCTGNLGPMNFRGYERRASLSCPHHRHGLCATTSGWTGRRNRAQRSTGSSRIVQRINTSSSIIKVHKHNPSTRASFPVIFVYSVLIFTHEHWRTSMSIFRESWDKFWEDTQTRASHSALRSFHI